MIKVLQTLVFQLINQQLIAKMKSCLKCQDYRKVDCGNGFCWV